MHRYFRGGLGSFGRGGFIRPLTRCIFLSPSGVTFFIEISREKKTKKKKTKKTKKKQTPGDKDDFFRPEGGTSK